MSEQQLVDCASGDEWGNNGCNGGHYNNAFHYCQYWQLVLETDYPYTGKDSAYCDESVVTSKGKVYAAYYEGVESNNPTKLKEALSKQPVSVAIQADKKIL